MIFSRDQPRTLEVLGELRALVDQYSEPYLIGEVLDVDMIAVSLSVYANRRASSQLLHLRTYAAKVRRFFASARDRID